MSDSYERRYAYRLFALCLCGVCTLSCTRQTTCGPIDGTRCVALSERSCGEASGSACLPIRAGMGVALEAGPAPLQTGESPSDCYAPDRDPAFAQASDAVGCECARQGLEYCAGGVAMACTTARDGLRWRTIPNGDGACELTVSNCGASHSRASPGECLAEYRMCAELSDGRFCGVGCYSQDPCPESGCEPRRGANGSVRPDAPSPTYQPHGCMAPELREYAKEGMCGDVHYRIVNYGTHGYRGHS